MYFTDRYEAGRQLARRLQSLRLARPVVLALPRGGVPLGFEIERRPQGPRDLVLVRKIGAPGYEELAIGAIADGDEPELVTDPYLVSRLAVSQSYLARAEAAALSELERRRQVYLGERTPVDLRGHAAIVVDDGIATGATMLAALRSARRRRPAELLLAVPVAASDSLEKLRQEADRIVCLGTPADFSAVGQFYGHFPQLTDAEVTALLDEAHSFATT